MIEFSRQRHRRGCRGCLNASGIKRTDGGRGVALKPPESSAEGRAGEQEISRGLTQLNMWSMAG